MMGRMRTRIGFLGLLLVAGIAETGGTQLVGDEATIRAARARSNRAIEAHDLETLSSFWTESFQIVTSRSARTSGRAANRDDMRQHFEALPDVVYVREPTEVTIYEPWAMAFERGTWKGSWTEQAGRVQIGGDYAAKWRKIEGRWLIDSELFSPTFCSGTPYCDESP